MTDWQPIETHRGMYEVSSSGVVSKCSGLVIGQWKNDQGYMMVRLSNPRVMRRVHRLVALGFIENPENLPFVNHKDCNRSNNTAANLEWCTQWQNLNHSQKLGRMKRDFWKNRRSPNAGIGDDTAQEIRYAYSRGGFSWSDLSEMFGISKRSVGRIVRGESYAR